MEQFDPVRNDERCLSGFYAGSGGNDPRVSTIDCKKLKVRTCLSLPQSHSAYEIEVSRRNDKIAIGTKGGKVIILESRQGTKVREPIYINQGAPVLSLCWVNEALIAISDLAGRCLLWNIFQTDIPSVLGTDGDFVVALVSLQEDVLAGLSNTGKIYLWNVFDSVPLSKSDVHLPPKMGAFVKIINWRQKGCLAFPGQGGHLVFYNTQTQKVDIIKAHDRDFYAIAKMKDSLLTIGMKDSLLKIWEPDSETPTFIAFLLSRTLFRRLFGKTMKHNFCLLTRPALSILTFSQMTMQGLLAA